MAMRQDWALIGVLLAAGRGRRAGGMKQLLPVVTGAGIMPLVCAAYDAVAWACASMIVVVGHERELVRGALGPREFEAVEVDPDEAMAESVRAGLRSAIHAGATHVLLHPGDHAWVERATLRRLVAALEGAEGRAVMPAFRGRGGHPVLIPAGVAHEIVADELAGGLREFWVRRAGLRIRVETPDAGVVRDVDRR